MGRPVGGLMVGGDEERRIRKSKKVDEKKR